METLMYVYALLITVVILLHVIKKLNKNKNKQHNSFAEAFKAANQFFETAKAIKELKRNDSKISSRQEFLETVLSRLTMFQYSDMNKFNNPKYCKNCGEHISKHIIVIQIGDKGKEEIRLCRQIKKADFLVNDTEDIFNKYYREKIKESFKVGGPLFPDNLLRVHMEEFTVQESEYKGKDEKYLTDKIHKMVTEYNQANETRKRFYVLASCETKEIKKELEQHLVEYWNNRNEAKTKEKNIVVPEFFFETLIRKYFNDKPTSKPEQDKSKCETNPEQEFQTRVTPSTIETTSILVEKHLKEKNSCSKRAEPFICLNCKQSFFYGDTGFDNFSLCDTCPACTSTRIEQVSKMKNFIPYNEHFEFKPTFKKPLNESLKKML